MWFLPILKWNSQWSTVRNSILEINLKTHNHKYFKFTGDDVVQVVIGYKNCNYLICTLQKGVVWQVPLDLVFERHTKISFTCNGTGHVHLTGYLILQPDDPWDDSSDEKSAELLAVDKEFPALVNSKKRKTKNSLAEQLDSKPQKKIKIDAEDEEDESDSEDGEGISFEDADDSDEFDDSEEDDDEDDDNESDDDDEDEDEEEEEEEEKEPTPQKKQKAQKKEKQNQQQSQQNQQNKKDKQKMMNGSTDKSAKQEQGKQKKNKENKNEEKPEKQQNQQKKRTVEGGVQIEELKEGNGPAAKPGKFVSVYYTGRLKNGKKFDSTTQGEGFKFKLGKGEVIKGWDVGIAGMKVGGKRRLVIPPNMAWVFHLKQWF